MNSRRENLQEYYDRVVVCKLCKKEYGLDKVKDDGICPICFVKLHQKKKNESTNQNL